MIGENKQLKNLENYLRKESLRMEKENKELKEENARLQAELAEQKELTKGREALYDKLNAVFIRKVTRLQEEIKHLQS